MIQASSSSSYSSCSSLSFSTNRQLEKPFPLKKLLVIINPFSGAGKAKEQFEQKVLPLWKERLDLEVVVTEQAGHGAKLIETHANLEEYGGIIGVGGDGIVAEIVTGLKRNNYHPDASQVPIGHIPCGSGNGLAMSLLYLNGRPYGIEQAAEMIATGQTSQMDLIEIRSATTTRWGFLSLSFGLLADLDIDSESCRCLGGQRFMLGAIKNLCEAKSYAATLSYLPEQEKEIAWPALNQPLPRQFVEIKGNFTLIFPCRTTHCSYNAFTAPEAKLDDGYIYLTYVMNTSRWTLFFLLWGLESGNYLLLPEVKQVKTKMFRFIPHQTEAILTLDGEIIPCESIQCRIEKAALSVFSSSKDKKAKTHSD